MSLSDDLTKMDTVSEGTCWKIYRQLTELKPDKKPTIDGVEVARAGRSTGSSPSSSPT